jgi:RNA polymerase sigma-70 factor, ECF subfamily
MEENELISGIQKGDKDAFKIFINQYSKFVVNVCNKFVNNPDDANDIAQEVFIEVYKTINKFRSESKISTWLYRICTNRSLNFIRNTKKYTSTESYSDDSQNYLSQTSGTELNPEENVLNEEKIRVINNAIDSLPDSQKSAFILCKRENISYAEISEVLDVSVKAVESLIIRAKKNLQKRLIDYYN